MYVRSGPTSYQRVETALDTSKISLSGFAKTMVYGQFGDLLGNKEFFLKQGRFFFEWEAKLLELFKICEII